jgi:hypothetical protein
MKDKKIARKNCEKKKREKNKPDPTKTPLTAVLIKNPEYKNLCKDINKNIKDNIKNG